MDFRWNPWESFESRSFPADIPTTGSTSQRSNEAAERHPRTASAQAAQSQGQRWEVADEQARHIWNQRAHEHGEFRRVHRTLCVALGPGFAPTTGGKR